MDDMKIELVRAKNSKPKSGRYWFRCSDEDTAFILSKMKKSDVADYFRECHENLFKALKQKHNKKKQSPITKQIGSPARVRTPKTKAVK